MRIDKTVHAPGTVLLIEMGGTIHEAVIVGWSPMGQAVQLMIGQSRVWLIAQKAHAIEFLKISGWDEFNRVMEEFEKEQAKKAQEAEATEMVSRPLNQTMEATAQTIQDRAHAE